MELIYALLRTLVGVVLVVGLTRANGLRTFSKMSGFDFALTLAIGSTLAGMVMADTQAAFWASTAALVMLFLFQGILARARTNWEPVRQRLDNGPLLLVENGEIIEENLARGNVTRADLIAKLREANVLRMQDARAVVLETTGDVSVLHGEHTPEDIILEGIHR